MFYDFFDTRPSIHSVHTLQCTDEYGDVFLSLMKSLNFMSLRSTSKLSNKPIVEIEIETSKLMIH